MSGDRIVAIVAILAMLVLVVPRTVRSGLPAPKLFRLALVWAVIFVAATAVVLIVA